MPRIAMWHPHKSLDFEFADRTSAENLHVGGAGLLIHKYEGVPGGDGPTDIGDFLFLENRNREYSDTVYELRGHFTPRDIEFDLSQFGLFLSSDVVTIVFHYNEMISLMGRKLLSGDVIEVPSERDSTIDGIAINEYFVVQDSLYSAPGHSFTWIPHLWKVRAKQMPASSEYQDVLDGISTGDTIGGEGNGTGIMPVGWANLVGPDGTPGYGCDPEISKAINSYCRLIGIVDEVVSEAEDNVFYDPKYFEVAHLWITIDEATNYPLISYWAGGDGQPPNGEPLKGIGVAFPEDIVDGEYFLRTDYRPDRLFQKQGNCFKRIEDDLRKIWTAYNKRLDTFIDNINTSVAEDGSIMREKQALSKVVSAKKDLNSEHKKETKIKKALHDTRAKKLDGVK